MSFRLLIILVCCIGGNSSAQVLFKCKDATTGQIVFSDVGCPKTHKITEIRDKPSESEVADNYARAEEGRQRYEADVQALTVTEARKSRDIGRAAVMNAGSSQTCISAQRNLKMNSTKDNRTAANIACMGAENAAKIEQENAKNTRKPMKCLPDGNGGYNCF